MSLYLQCTRQKDLNLRMLDEQLTHSSLGLEHFFREMGAVFENLMALKERSKCSDFDDILDKLSDAMAEIVIEGSAIEIMDGDAIHVPVSWLKAVLNKVEQNGSIRVSKVSVLGAQSCGKSTLLNTSFGLNFPVSSGRCTRGAYMQLVKVDEEFKKTLNCDYVLVIDSEGLMSRVKSASSDYDNELSTFVIGLSDLTLVVIKGEGNEMQDVLPLAIHVFLRMNIVGEYQACHFVHQNMGAVDVMKVTAKEIDAFVQDLDVKTSAAAMDVDKSDRYTVFTDVLHYDKTKDNTYVPGLWDGTLPMAKSKTHYSQTMQELKSDILQHVVQINKEKGLSTFSDFTKRVDELWDAIKYENFVLSFQNVLAVEAHSKLTKIFDAEQWAVKRDVREMIQTEQHKISNEMRRSDSQKSLSNLIYESSLNITKHIMKKVPDVEKQIMHYLQCMGCEKCSNEVRNRHLLVSYEREFKDEVATLHRALLREMESTMDTLEVKLKADSRIHELNTQMDNVLKQKVHDAIRRKKNESFDDDYEDIFAQLWIEATGDILRKVRYRDEEKVDINAAIQGIIINLLGKDSQFYVREIEGRDIRQQLIEENDHLFVHEKHLQLKGIFGRYLNLWGNEQDIQRLQGHTDRIVQLTRKHYDRRSSPSGKTFNHKDCEMMFQDVLKQIDEISDERFKTTVDYKVDLVIHIEELAVKAFTEMHEKYCKESSPKALLDKKKRSYYDLFMIKMGQGDAAAKFCENVLKDMILKNIEDQLSCTELLHTLRVHCGEIFRDIKSLQASIMIDLFQENTFEKYIGYIASYETFIKEKMMTESVRYFSQKDQLKHLGHLKADQIISTIQESVDRTCENSRNEEHCIKTLFSNIENLKIPHTEAAAFLGIDVPDRKQFGAIIYQQLRDPVKKDIVEAINTWAVTQKLEEKNLVDFLFTELVGCSAKCPFCKVPCDTHSGGKTSGNHSSTLHRARGLGGYRFIGNQTLVAEDCRAGVASNTEFLHESKYTSYKQYYEVFPDWTIHGDTDPDVEKYWKWVLAQYNTEFAKYYSARKANIPAEWAKYQRDEIVKDVEDNYHVKVNM